MLEETSTHAGIDSRGLDGVSFPCQPLRWTAFHGRMAGAARSLGWNPFPGPAAVNSQAYDRSPGMRLSRVLQQRWLSDRREERHAYHDHSEGCRHGQSQSGHSRARHDARGGLGRTRDRRQLRRGKQRVLPAGEGRLDRLLHLRKRSACCSCRNPARIQTGCRTTMGRWAGTTSVITRARVWGRSFRTTSRRGTASRHRASQWMTGPTTTSDHSDRRFHRGRKPLGHVGPPADFRGEHEHVWPKPELGVRVEEIYPRTLRSNPRLLHSEDDPALRGQLPRFRSPR